MAAIFVCGASGTQGGALVKHLQKANIKIHALARDPSSAANQALQAAGVSLTKGDFDDEDALRQSMQGCTGAFLNFMPDLTNTSRERSWAQRILRVAKEAGVQHIVYTTGLGTKDPQRYPSWNPDSFVAKIMLSKQTIEEDVRSAGFKNWTILHPGNFMTNFLPPHVFLMHRGLVENGRFSSALLPETILPMVDPDDIGKFGAAAFLDPAKFDQKEVGIASDLLVLDDIVSSLSRAVGRELKVDFMPQDEIDSQLQGNPFLEGQILMRDMIQFVDMDEVRSWGIPLNTFEMFLEREKDRVAGAFST